MVCYKGTCPICNKNMFVDTSTSNTDIQYIYQGKIKRYFHLSCLDSIKRGKTNG